MFDIGLAGGQQCGDDTASFFTHDVAVGAGYFPDQTVGSEQAALAGDGAGPLLLFLFASFGGKKQGAQIAVAKTVDGKFAAIDDFQKTSVWVGRIPPSTSHSKSTAYGIADVLNIRRLRFMSSLTTADFV